MADCIYKDKETGWCKLRCDWSEPMAYIEYCVEAPCPDEKFQTNADRIRAMSDEELAEFLILSPEMEFEPCRYCINGNTAPDDRGQCLRPNGHCYANDRCEAFKKWLKQEAGGTP